MRRMAKYIYHYQDWPDFTWNTDELLGALANVRNLQGRLLGKMEGLGFALKEEAILDTLTLDVQKSSEIEGEIYKENEVRSSIARKLGLNISGLVSSDRDVDGVVEMMLDATQQYEKGLDEERLFGWHASLFPAGEKWNV